MSDGMERFSDYPDGEMPRGVKFKVVVPTANDAEQVRQALRYLHNGDIDTDIVSVNTLVHAYLMDPFIPPAICVDKDEYERVCGIANRQGKE